MEKSFNQIKKFYKKHSRDIGSIRTTKSGVWGPSDCDIIFSLFKKIDLQSYKHFIDLGSGDGRVALIASLFTRSTGFELDKTLMNFAKRCRNELQLDAELHTRDFLKHDLKKYDCLFIYPDRSTHLKLKKKLVKELKGKLLVYKIYKPDYLEKIKDYKFKDVTVSEFRNSKF